MRVPKWVCVLFLAPLALAAETMDVSVCPMGRVNPKDVAAARTQAAALFAAMGVEIVWRDCEAAPIGVAATQQHWFTVRLRDDGPAVRSEIASADTLGEAFFSDEGGYVADVYYHEILTLAARKGIDEAPLLAYVMAHELGHLLLGPAHAPCGIMRASWDRNDLDAVRMGWLQFGPSEIARIHKVLQRTAAPPPPSVAS